MPVAPHKRKLIVSPVWLQASVLVFLFGFFVLGLLAYRTYEAAPPIPDTVVDPAGEILFTENDIKSGQHIFLRNGLMQYGSIFGHGGYLGPDYTADYLRRAALSVSRAYGDARERTIGDFKENRYDPATGVLQFTAAQASAFQEVRLYYQDFFSRPNTSAGLRPEAITDPEEIRQLTAFFAWTAWAAAAQRPGKAYSYTNNWPPEPLVNNHPTGAMILWSILSLAALLGGVGFLFAAYGRYDFLGWHGHEQRSIAFRRPGDVALTPAQRSCAWFFLVMALFFLAQTLTGGASQHYRAEVSHFFGFDLAQILPFNLARTWHVQLAIFWVATSYL